MLQSYVVVLPFVTSMFKTQPIPSIRTRCRAVGRFAPDFTEQRRARTELQTYMRTSRLLLLR